MTRLHSTLIIVIGWLFLLPLELSAQPGALLEGDQHTSQRFEKVMVTAGEPLACEVGAEILRRGGNAVDSATAVGFALAVTLPRAGNLGGGGFSLILDKGVVHALDFRETAPAKLHRDFYLEAGHSSRRGPTSAGVPGTVAGLWEMHQKFGVLPWQEVVKPAQRLAQEGFPVSPWLFAGLLATEETLTAYPETERIFFPQNRPPAIGAILVQQDLAKTLSRISKHGMEDFYRGETARRLTTGVQNAGGVMTLQDLDAYKPKWREPVSGMFRGYKVWSMPPPSSGGIHTLQMLALLADLDLVPPRHNSAEYLHLVAEAMRLAYCDRALYLGDPDFVNIPQDKLLSKEYLAGRKALLPLEKAGDSRSLAPELLRDPVPESPETTHFNVVDKDGMAVSFTYTLNFSYGSGFVAPGTGFLLNDEMDDFNAKPGQPNAYGLVGSEANNVEAGKRPLSSMTPTIVTKDGHFVASLGAPGGSRIINGVFQVLLNLLGYGFNPQTAVTLPRIHHQWYPDKIYHELGFSSDTLAILEKKGHQIEPIYAVAHVLAIVKDPEGFLEAGLDPRRPSYAEGY
jgi:gamma-glutamyltranspeptidase / glutathione hydrolase